MSSVFQRYFLPGLVIQAVVVGGTYATGREVTEFFLKLGKFPGFVGLCLTTVLYSFLCMAAFEFARQHKIFDYKSFCAVYMGPFWVFYEFGFLCSVMLTLSVVTSATAEITLGLFGADRTVSSFAFMGVVALLVFAGSNPLERMMSAWSVFFYATYLGLLIVIVRKFGDPIAEAFVFEPITLDAIGSALLYTAFSGTILPILIFVARHFQSRKDALVAGGLCGPALFLPGFSIFFMLVPFYPQVVHTPIPISLPLQNAGWPLLEVAVQVAILGTLAATGAGLLHGLNERMNNAIRNRHAGMSKMLRVAVALATMLFSIYLASAVGIIDLVAHGFRYGAAYFITILVVLPLARYLWLLGKRRHDARDDERRTVTP